LVQAIVAVLSDVRGSGEVELLRNAGKWLDDLFSPAGILHGNFYLRMIMIFQLADCLF
jgi:hypothetical protein